MAKTQEYWVWPESDWQSNEIDWKNATKISAGVDIGTTSTQAVVMVDDKLFAYANIATSCTEFKETADRALKLALGSTGMDVKDIGDIAATGFGSQHVEYATKCFDEIKCHGKGAKYIFGSDVITVVDMGGQTTKAIRMYEWDRVRDFIVNDKCATGMGRNIELMCDELQIPITEIGEKSLEVEKDPEPVSHTCYSFANPEVIGLFRQGYKEQSYNENDVIASYIFTIAWRIMGTIGKLQPLDPGDVQVYQPIAFTGGLAKNIGITSRIEREFNVKALTSEYDPQLAGAIGAALLV